MKRIIFTLLYQDGYFIQSRNFRRQKVGNKEWLFEKYEFLEISFGIDEVIIIDVSLNKNFLKFCNVVSQLSKKLFVPLTAGGGIKSSKDVTALFNAGADKILLNKLYFENYEECEKIAKNFGNQSIICSIDYKISKDNFEIYFRGQNKVNINFLEWINKINNSNCGEIIFQSVNKDGTGMGADEYILKFIENFSFKKPVVVMGGIGHGNHIKEVLSNNKISAVSTANLFNFIGDAFLNIREQLINEHIDVVNWDARNMNTYKDIQK